MCSLIITSVRFLEVTKDGVCMILDSGDNAVKYNNRRTGVNRKTGLDNLDGMYVRYNDCVKW